MFFFFRVKEFVQKTGEQDDEVTEVEASSSTQKKSRLDTEDEDETTLTDDGRIWSKPLPESHEANRSVVEQGSSLIGRPTNQREMNCFSYRILGSNRPNDPFNVSPLQEKSIVFLRMFPFI